jgi:hypothetical protein
VTFQVETCRFNLCFHYIVVLTEIYIIKWIYIYISVVVRQLILQPWTPPHCKVPFIFVLNLVLRIALPQSVLAIWQREWVHVEVLMLPRPSWGSCGNFDCKKATYQLHSRLLFTNLAFVFVHLDVCLSVWHIFVDRLRYVISCRWLWLALGLMWTIDTLRLTKV